MKPKFTIYKSSFYIYTICQIYTVNIAKELHASGGGVLFWPTYGLKMLFTILFLLVYLNNIPSLKEKTFKLTFIFAMVTKNGHQNGLKNGKANIFEQIWDIWQRINVNSNTIFYQVIKIIRTHNILKAF